MTATFELSLYPLIENYPPVVIGFIESLRSWKGVEVKTSGLSTTIIGEYTQIWNALGQLTQESLTETEGVLLIKVALGRREYND